jgi:fructoselysine-6-P-deglycase FrlB-like protein
MGGQSWSRSAVNEFLQDILDQPAALQSALDFTLNDGMAALQEAAEALRRAKRIVLTSMGSAYYSLMPLHHVLARWHPSVHLVEAAELLTMPLQADTQYLILSRSGESGEIAELSARLHSQGKPLIAITMTAGSTLAKHASLLLNDPVPYDHFICTKAYSSMALVGLLLASQADGTLEASLAGKLKELFAWMEESKAGLLQKVKNVDWLDGPLYFLSCGAGNGLAQAGTLWLQEAARQQSSAMSIQNFLHGPVEQVDENFRGIWIDLTPSESSRALFNRVCSHGGHWLGLAVEDNQADFCIPSFGLPEAYRVLSAVMPVQLIAYQTASNLGLEAGRMRYLDWVVK